MTKLYSTDLDAEAAGGAALSGWTAINGGFGVRDVSTLSGQVAISGANVYAGSSESDSAAYSAGGVLANQAIRTALRVVALDAANYRAAGHILRSNTLGDVDVTQYRILLETDGATTPALRLSIYNVTVGGSVLLASTAYLFSPSPTDLVHFESKVVGNVIESRLWLNSASRPSTPTITFTVASNTIASGYPGVRHKGAFGWAISDNIVITDAAGGEDFFYPAVGTTINLTGSNSTQSATSSSGVVVVTTAPAGTITSSPMKSWFTKLLRPNETGITVFVYDQYGDTGDKVVKLTGQSSNASGIWSGTNALFVIGRDYLLRYKLADGSWGAEVVTAT